MCPRCLVYINNNGVRVPRPWLSNIIILGLDDNPLVIQSHGNSHMATTSVSVSTSSLASRRTVPDDPRGPDL